jgi:trehalose 2-sulfotransferase
MWYCLYKETLLERFKQVRRALAACLSPILQGGYVRPHTCYLVCATPRSGSTLLCEVLTNTGIAGQPKEYFQPPHVKPRDYFKHGKFTNVTTLLREFWPDSETVEPTVWDGSNYADYLAQVFEQGTSPNGVFGAKLMWGHIDYFTSKLESILEYRGLTVPALLSTVFPNLHYIYVRRQDKLRQAISLWKAIQTWTWKADDPPQQKGKRRRRSRQPLFNYEAIDYLRQQLEAHDVAWQHYFEENGIEPFTVVYEEWTSVQEATALSILQYLNIAIPENLVLPEPGMQRQADELTEEWVKLYNIAKREREEKMHAD